MKLNRMEIHVQKLADKGMIAPEIAKKMGWGESNEALAKVRSILIKPHHRYHVSP